MPWSVPGAQSRGGGGCGRGCGGRAAPRPLRRPSHGATAPEEALGEGEREDGAIHETQARGCRYRLAATPVDITTSLRSPPPPLSPPLQPYPSIKAVLSP